ncbi:DUF2203 family protein [Candidatus Poribacteria bacterium]|nr:DUF2203 family protein [Candidatus Poribacteria bacterium]
MPTFQTYIEISEAQALIPVVRQLFARIHQLLTEPILRDMADGLVAPAPGFHAESAGAMPDSVQPQLLPILRSPLPATTEGRKDEINRILRALLLRGIVIQDIWRGLIDFPHLLDGTHEVLLCYELADGDSIQWYHDLTTGFAGRTPLPKHMVS